jgi:hypothetical protein
VRGGDGAEILIEPPLVDLRIHDITVVADPNRRLHDEPELEVADGTSDGRYESASTNSEVASYWNVLNDICSQIASWWEGFWPRIHLMLAFATLAGGLAVLHFSVDLLMDLRFENSSIDTPLDDLMTPNQRNEWSASAVDAVTTSSVQNDFLKFTGWAIIASLGVLSFLIAASPFPDPWKYTAMLIHFAAFGTWLSCMILALSQGWISLEFVVGLLSAILSIAMGGAVTLLLSASILFILFLAVDTVMAWKILFWAPPRFYWGIIGIGYFFFLATIMWIVLSAAVETSLANYLGIEL